MAVIALGTVGGLTDLGTICLHVASLWPHPPLVVEADPDGGRLAARHNWDLRPSLGDLVTLLNSGETSAISIDRVTRRLRNGIRVVVAPPAMEAVHSVLCEVLPSLSNLESRTTGDVLIDVGVIRPDSPARDIIAAASKRIIVVRKDVEDLVALAHRRSLLESMGTWSVLTAGGRLRSADAIGAIRWPILADLLPNDRRSSVALRTSLARFATAPDRIRLPA
jgi:hypothetical protein